MVLVENMLIIPLALYCNNNNNNYQVKPCPGLPLVRTTDDTAGNNSSPGLPSKQTCWENNNIPATPHQLVEIS